MRYSSAIYPPLPLLRYMMPTMYICRYTFPPPGAATIVPEVAVPEAGAESKKYTSEQQMVDADMQVRTTGLHPNARACNGSRGANLRINTSTQFHALTWPKWPCLTRAYPITWQFREAELWLASVLCGAERGSEAATSVKKRRKGSHKPKPTNVYLDIMRRREAWAPLEGIRPEEETRITRGSIKVRRGRLQATHA
jgi:hypothetical protein